MTMKTCPQCQTAHDDGKKFCQGCGAALTPIQTIQGFPANPVSGARSAGAQRKTGILAAAAVALLLVLGAGGYWFIAGEAQANANTSKTRAEARKGSIPTWLYQVATQPVVPGKGLGGIYIGQAESQALGSLGPASWGPNAGKAADGTIFQYSTGYQYGTSFLGVYTHPNNRAVRSLRLYDKDFNRDGLLPVIKNNLTIGSSRQEMLEVMGQPLRTNDHSTCPENTGSLEATTYSYPGIELCVCKGNDKIYWIDMR